MSHNIADEIRLDNDWRSKDIAKMKMTYTQIPEENQSFFLRLCIPMIYAHWEGVVANSIVTLIKYLNNLRLKHDEVPINIFVLSIGDKFKYLQSNQSFEQRCNFSSTFIGKIQSDLSFDKNVGTKSNLKFEVLTDICEVFRFDISDFEPYKNEINNLVDIRNRIAHGENAYLLELPQIEKYFILLEKISDIFMHNIEKFLLEERYKHSVIT